MDYLSPVLFGSIFTGTHPISFRMLSSYVGCFGRTLISLYIYYRKLYAGNQVLLAWTALKTIELGLWCSIG